jgi:hypothetical protein
LVDQQLIEPKIDADGGWGRPSRTFLGFQVWNFLSFSPYVFVVERRKPSQPAPQPAERTAAPYEGKHTKSDTNPMAAYFFFFQKIRKRGETADRRETLG